MNKKLWLILGLCLIFPATVLAAETAVWGWYRGTDACALWEQGCVDGDYARIPAAPAWNVITTTRACNAIGVLQVETRSGMPPRALINGAAPPVFSVPVGSRISVQAAVPITDGVIAVTLSCVDVPPLEDMQPIEYDPNQHTAIVHFETLNILDVFNMGRYALTYWRFIQKTPFIKEMLLALVVLPLAMTVIYRRLQQPPEI